MIAIIKEYCVLKKNLNESNVYLLGVWVVSYIIYTIYYWQAEKK